MCLYAALLIYGGSDAKGYTKEAISQTGRFAVGEIRSQILVNDYFVKLLFLVANVFTLVLALVFRESVLNYFKTFFNLVQETFCKLLGRESVPSGQNEANEATLDSRPESPQPNQIEANEAILDSRPESPQPNQIDPNNEVTLEAVPSIRHLQIRLFLSDQTLQVIEANVVRHPHEHSPTSSTSPKSRASIGIPSSLSDNVPKSTDKVPNVTEPDQKQNSPRTTSSNDEDKSPRSSSSTQSKADGSSKDPLDKNEEDSKTANGENPIDEGNAQGVPSKSSSNAESKVIESPPQDSDEQPSSEDNAAGSEKCPKATVIDDVVHDEGTSDPEDENPSSVSVSVEADGTHEPESDHEIDDEEGVEPNQNED